MCSTRDNRGKVDAETRGRGDAEIGTWSAVSASRLDRARRGPCLRVSASCLFIVACLLATLVGCSTEQKVVYEPVNQTPIVGDEAMALRADWPKSVSHYANGTVVAYSPRFPYDTNVGHPTSGAVFLYFEGPDGMTYEYSTGVRMIPVGAEHSPRQFPFHPTSFCMWGSKPDIPEFKT